MKLLEGVKILEFTQALSGPYAGMMFSDLGADIIKLERPPLGDTSRYNAPGKGGTTPTFSSRNRGKKSMLMDLKDPRQKDIFLKMVEDADIILENFKPGTMEKFGCGYEDLKKIKKDIILVSISGYGQTGPMHARAAYDLTVQAEAGLMSITGTKEGEFVGVGYSVSDTLAGMNACTAALAALHYRDKTGEGKHIDIAMMDSLLSTMETPLGTYYLTGRNTKPQGIGQPLSAPFSDFPLQGGKRMLLCVNSDAQWEKLCSVLHCEKLMENPHFTSSALRKQHEPELIEAMIPYTEVREQKELMEALEKEHLIYGQINTISDVVESEQFKERNMRISVHYQDSDVDMPATASAFKIVGEEPDTDYTAYPLGYHTIEISSKYVSAEEAHDIYDGVIEKSKAAAAAMILRNNIG